MIYGSRLKSLIYGKGYTLTMINDELNIRNNTDKTVQNLSHRINSESLKYTELLQILDILHYRCKWIPNTYDEEEAKMHIRELYKLLHSETGEDYGITIKDIYNKKRNISPSL